MGSYTRFWGSVTVLPEHQDLIRRVCDWKATPNAWSDLVPDYPWLEEYAYVERSSFIPRGSYAGYPTEYAIDATGVWTFDCRLKDYQHTIAAFLRLVLPVIAHKAELKVQYEEFDTPDEYVFADGALTKVKEATWSR